MASHPIDMSTIGNSFSTAEMRAVWDEGNRLRTQLEVEAALALAEAELGLIPTDAAARIAAAAAEPYDLTELAAAGAAAMHSLNATVQALQHRAGEAGEWVHWGVTTQDIVDTGMVLQIGQALTIIERDARAVASALVVLAETHRETVMVARTHYVQALPTTFGFVVAVWLDEFLRHLDRLERARQLVLVGGINGAVGNFSAFGALGPAVQDATLRRLGLASPRISWQSSPDRIAEYAASLTLISTSLGKIATNLSTLMHTEIGEVEEPFSPGKIGSTTMPHKRNPALLEGVAALTAPVKHALGLIMDAQNTLHSRDAISWRAEWLGVPELHLYLSSQLAVMARLLPGLVVKADRMAANLDLQGGLVMSEHAMFELGRVTGKQTAHAIVYRAAMAAEETGTPFSRLLSADPQVAEHFTPEQVAGWLDARNYLGDAVGNVDRVLAAARERGL